MKNIEALIKSRYSCRNFLHTPVSQAVIGQLLDVARFAPSAVNFQPCEITVFTLAENLQKLYQSYNREWFKTAPAVLLFCADKNKAWKRADGKNHGDIDIAIMVDHFTLLATEMGLGTCWICNFDAAVLTRALLLPAHLEPVVLLPLGYPANNDIPTKKRKDLQEFVHWDTLPE